MTEAIFGLIGVLMGSAISLFQSYWADNRITRKSARYLAIRVVCILDKYLEDCTEVVKDDGLSFGQRSSEGYLEPQVKAPGAPVFPDDVDWKSIDHELMYQILSFPSQVEYADRLIKGTRNFADPPDFEDWFNERKFHYSQFGLEAYRLSEELCRKYSIQKKIYNNWDPVADLKSELNKVMERRQRRIQSHSNFVKKILGNK
ncbi:hypothetical protein [Niabella hirudinis]|uniref:hypothetical protein n=1 Tax=Niabella hirudinis TaxID=1285929 RepID=UPI003EBAD493